MKFEDQESLDKYTTEKSSAFISMVNKFYDFYCLNSEEVKELLNRPIENSLLLDFLNKAINKNFHESLFGEFLEIVLKNPEHAGDLVDLLSKEMDEVYKEIQKIKEDKELKQKIYIEPKETLSKLLRSHYEEQYPSHFPPKQ